VTARAHHRRSRAQQGHWFLPETPDLLSMLTAQVAVTFEGMDAFAAWAASGDPKAAEQTHEFEHRADESKRDLQRTLRAAFVTPLEPEDLFALSQGIDSILNQAKDLVGESEVMACPPDAALAEMAALMPIAMRDIGEAVAHLGTGGEDTIAAAEAAIKDTRHIEKAYRRGMAALIEREDLRDVIARRELYRRCSRIADAIRDVAERIEYALAKES
jgi:uncharacterized protein Yka (UPF0111/DUF47 family)